jgi:ParB-like chromosome segregation protein Spo0J
VPTRIIEPLRGLAVPIDNLISDPDNARRGDVAAIRRSLNVFGQRKPVVAKLTGTDADGRPTGIVTAGNHTLQAARDLGWSDVAAVFVDDDATTAKAYALADNRTAELATWDADQLAENLRSLTDAEFDTLALGWSETELGKLTGDPADLTEFKEYDESAADDVKLMTCPECGHEFPP